MFAESPHTVYKKLEELSKEYDKPENDGVLTLMPRYRNAEFFRMMGRGEIKGGKNYQQVAWYRTSRF